MRDEYFIVGGQRPGRNSDRHDLTRVARNSVLDKNVTGAPTGLAGRIRICACVAEPRSDYSSSRDRANLDARPDSYKMPVVIIDEIRSVSGLIAALPIN